MGTFTEHAGALPVSCGRADNDMSWYEFCVSYVDMKWKDSSAHHRENIAWALVYPEWPHTRSP
jgi:hypothetical protein